MAATEAVAKAPGKANLIVTIAALTVFAAVGGGVSGKLIMARLRPAAATPTTEQAPPLPYASDVEVKELPAIVTNLASPPEMRVRMQVSIVYAKKGVENPSVLIARINDDLVAFVKTLTVRQIQGASGLQNLREDLTERASVRSQGMVREVVIESLVVQ